MLIPATSNTTLAAGGSNSARGQTAVSKASRVIEGQLWITPLLDISPSNVPAIPVPLPGRCSVSVAGSKSSNPFKPQGYNGVDQLNVSHDPAQVTITSWLTNKTELLAMGLIQKLVVTKPVPLTHGAKPRLILHPTTAACGITSIWIVGYTVSGEPRGGWIVSLNCQQVMPAKQKDPQQDANVVVKATGEVLA